MTPLTCWLQSRKFFSSSLIVRECVNPDLVESLVVTGRITESVELLCSDSFCVGEDAIEEKNEAQG